MREPTPKILEMKTKLATICMAALLGAFATVTTSCSDDENEPVVIDGFRLDDLDYVRRNLLRTDSEGQFLGLLYGAFIDESLPTTAFIGVDDMEDARQMWEGLIPYDAEVMPDGVTVVLTDEDGSRQGTMMFHNLDGVKEIAEITFSSLTLIDSHLSRIVFIPNSLWPNNDAPQVFPVPTIMTRTKTGERYAVISMPQNGNPGYLLSVGEKTYFTARQHDEGVKMKQYASVKSMSDIGKQLRGDQKGSLWEQLSKASGIKEQDLRMGRYFVSQTSVLSEFVYSIRDNKVLSIAYIPNSITNTTSDKWAGSWNYPTKVYKITNENGDYDFSLDHAFPTTKISKEMATELNLMWDDFEPSY